MHFGLRNNKYIFSMQINDINSNRRKQAKLEEKLLSGFLSRLKASDHGRKFVYLKIEF